jgi:hypothetical protein
MSSKYVMVNVEMPAEVKPDGSINPLQYMVKTRVVRILKSLDEIDMTDMPPSLIAQVNAIFEINNQKEQINSNQVSDVINTDDDVGSIDNNIINNDNNIKQAEKIMYVLKDECKKTPQKKTNNCSFKNKKSNATYNNRKTMKIYSAI